MKIDLTPPQQEIIDTLKNGGSLTYNIMGADPLYNVKGNFVVSPHPATIRKLLKLGLIVLKDYEYKITL